MRETDHNTGSGHQSSFYLPRYCPAFLKNIINIVLCFALFYYALEIFFAIQEEALLSVPDSYREGSFGLGAGKLRTIFKIVLPDENALLGIFATVPAV